jgi:hypothetical protein
MTAKMSSRWALATRQDMGLGWTAGAAEAGAGAGAGTVCIRQPGRESRTATLDNEIINLLKFIVMHIPGTSFNK